VEICPPAAGIYPGRRLERAFGARSRFASSDDAGIVLTHV
jgi:hypothetical protein